MTTIDEELDIEELLNEEGAYNERTTFEHWRIEVDPGQTPVRVDKFLFEHRPNVSRNRIQKAAEAGCIQADGKPVKSNYKVKGGEVITLMLDRPKRIWEITPEDIPLDIVYEDPSLLVVNKAAGMVVHPGCGNFSQTLVNALAYHLKDETGFDPNDPAVGICHRIDKETSGLLVVAKTAETKTDLCKQFYDHSTKRTYLALVWGNFDEEKGTVEGNIARDPKDRMRMTVLPPDSEAGKPAVTHYEVLERFDHVTLLRCRLETGRTHQIRAHMKHIGHVLFNDERYGGHEILWGERTSSYKAFISNCLKVCPRQALHAETLGFTHPATKEEMFFNAALPADMQALLEKWRKRV
ncbi:MAG: RluA family pseudouridine synthase [Prevotellaceae bacterium]|nr:RluA family pseudouridine synthase [Prevotellaceae bacterium]